MSGKKPAEMIGDRIVQLEQENASLSLERDELKIYAGELEEALKAKQYDDLTGLIVRPVFMDRLATEFESARRYKYPLSVLFIDGDNFGLINKLRGEAAGDDVIRELGKALKIRASDGIAYFPSRRAGDEFNIYTSHTNKDQALALGRKLIERMYERTGIGISIGTATYNGEADIKTYETLLERADMAMRKAKKNGGNRVVAYEPDRQEEMFCG